MNLHRVLFVLLAAVPFTATSVLSQTSAPPTAEAPSPAAENASSVIPSGTAIPIALSKSIDAKKARPGDRIEARTTMDLLSHGQILVPRDTKVTGHVTEAKARSKESSDSNLGITFDRISMKDGRDLSMRTSVQAIGPSLNEVPSPRNEAPGKLPSDKPPDPGWAQKAMGTGPRLGPSPSPSGDTPDPAPPLPSEGSESAPALDPHARGVIGLKGLSLSSSDQSSLISSTSNNVHLEGGTQFVLRTAE